MSRKEYESLEKRLLETEYIRDIAFMDWAETDTRIKNLTRPLLGEWVDGDDWGVPQIDDIVEKLMNIIKEKK